ncbi:Aminopeptidase 1 [Grifola frondosa]|uniref:Aminopeptidase n=1 Tax=Grifola frondosa TaxID=5627 RepID=A0A1C7MF29_GRIFR|nr:Aminopeptidase 1 [Grifola frondosa]
MVLVAAGRLYTGWPFLRLSCGGITCKPGPPALPVADYGLQRTLVSSAFRLQPPRKSLSLCTASALASTHPSLSRLCPYIRNHSTAASHITMASFTPPSPPDDQANYRLPTSVKPTHYNLTVRTDLVNSKFDGTVEILLDVNTETSTVVLNTADLNIGEVSLFSEALRLEQTHPSRAFDSGLERGSFTFATSLPAKSKAQLKIAFDGDLTSNMLGYYRSSGGNEDKTKYYSLTQFEPTAARRAFPCWDEPLLKATFDITLISRADTVNLSNMPVISEEIYKPGLPQDNSWLSKKFASLSIDDPAEQWKVTQFATTPPVSTYLVAYANGHLKYLESSYRSPLSGKVRPLRIYGTHDYLVCAICPRCEAEGAPNYEQVFDIEYPLPKLDTLVAHDFDSGAMENCAFLLDPEKADLRAKKLVASTQSHEVAHMWFGNITTMAWWDNLYLNEGFATLCPRARCQVVFTPIEVECPDANDQPVLRMLSNYVGEARFLKGVSIYLKNHLYKNSVTKDLWEGIQAATGDRRSVHQPLMFELNKVLCIDLDIPKMMDNWVKKMGYPVITVAERPNGIHVRQDRFLETGPAEPKDNETIWTVPLFILTVSERGDVVIDKEIILDQREMFIPIDTSRPFKLNAGTVGFFSVLYSSERLKAIGHVATKSPSPFSAEDRIGLVYDALTLAKAGFSNVSSALGLIEILRDENEYLVWESIAINIDRIVSTWWENSHVVELLNNFRNELFVPIVHRLGFEYSDDESVDTRQLRTKAIEQAAAGGDKEVIKELTIRFAHYMKTGDSSGIPPDLVAITYKTSGHARNGASEGIDLAAETFRFILTDARDQDTFYYFYGLQRNFKTRRYLATAFKEHYDVFEKRYTGNFSLIRLIEISFNALSSEEDYQDTLDYFKDKDTSKYEMSLQQTLDNIHARAAWVKRSTTDIATWLEGR